MEFYKKVEIRRGGEGGTFILSLQHLLTYKPELLVLITLKVEFM